MTDWALMSALLDDAATTRYDDIMEPTAEQARILDLAATGDNVAIQAGAGTGKTTTLVAIARAAAETGRRGLYLAFNKAIVVEAGRKLPHNMTAKTLHSLAYASHGSPMRHRLNANRVPSWDIAKALDIRWVTVGRDDPATGAKSHSVRPNLIAGYVMRALGNFYNTADAEPTVRHFSPLKGLEPEGQWTLNNELAAKCLPYLTAAWADVQSTTGRLPFSHDAYAKLFQLSKPLLGFDFLLVDEAQDLSPVQLDVVQVQMAAGVQVILVGDDSQRIYSWRGSINAMELVGAANTGFLTESFRFGAAIAEAANVALSAIDAPIRLIGQASIPSQIVYSDLSGADAVICRTNAHSLEQVLDLRAAGRTAHLVGGGGELRSFANAAAKLQEGKKVEHADLGIFETWDDVVDFVANDPQGDELAASVKLVERFGTGLILSALSGLASAEEADVTVTTAHKAKGLEWGSVVLGGDWPDPAKLAEAGKTLNPEEIRLAYVAMTRAQLALDYSRSALAAWLMAGES